MTRSLLERERRGRPGLGDDEIVRAIAAKIIEDVGIAEPPVSLDMVRSWLDIQRVIEDPTLTVAGCLLCGTQGIEIRVRAGDNVGRKRFTIAHECAHTFFPGFELQPQYRCSPRAVGVAPSGLESLCDLAASELLLPTALFVPAAADEPFGFDGLSNLAATFEASLLATAYRLTSVLTEPIAVLVFEPANKPRDPRGAAPKLRLQSARTSSRWAHFLRHKSVTPDDVIDRASNGEFISETTILRDICATPVHVEVHAQSSPYLDDHGLTRHRVLALLRQLDPARPHG